MKSKTTRTKKRQIASLIAPLLEIFRENGVDLTDKARQALILAAEDAKTQEYRSLYDDSILVGLIRSQGSITHLLSSMGIDLETFIQEIHGPVPDLNDDYRKDYRNKRLQKDRRRKKKKPFGLAGAPDAQTRETGELPERLSHLSGTVDSEALFTAVLSMPAVWFHVQKTGLSANKLRRHVEYLQRIEPDIETQKYSLSFDGKKYFLEAFDFLDLYSIPRNEERPENDLIICRINILTPRQLVLEERIEEFESLINRSRISEYDIQRFLEKNPAFLLGIEHKSLQGQLTLTREGMSDLRPDFFMERVDGPLCDIAELKLPNARVVVGRPNRRTFSSGIISAVGQLKEYYRYFDDPRNRERFYRENGLQAYKPKLFVVIGRSCEFLNPFERVDLQGQLSTVNIITYDDLILRAKQRLNFIAG